MNKLWKKHDKKAQRTVCMETTDFNKLLEEVNAGVRVIPRQEEVCRSYEAYRAACMTNSEVPLSGREYEEKYLKYFSATCSFENVQSDNVPCEVLIGKALDIDDVKVSYAKDRYGKWTEKLEVTYYAK